MSRSEVLSFLKANALDVFPLNGKVPTCKWQEPYNRQIQSEENFGVKLGGNSKIFVIDVDDYSLIEHFRKYLEITYVVKTGKGFHIYIRVDGTLPPILRLNNQKGQHIDIQSTGTYVVGETSVHPETKKHYEIISTQRNINNIDFNEIKLIIEKLGFNTTKKSITDRESKAIKEGIPKGNRNNELFAIACHTLKSVKDPEIAYNHIASINEKSPEPLPKEEIDQLFQSATETVQKEIEESNSKIKINNNVDYTILDEEPQQLRALTLDQDNTRHVLVYLLTKVEKKERNKQGEVINVRTDWVSKAYIVSNGVNGKEIRALDTQYFKEKYVSNLYSEFPDFSNRWKNKDIKKYLTTNEKVNPKELFDDMLITERRYFENQYDYDYYFETLWKTHTYFYTLFDITPYSDYTGMKNVGKTKRLTLHSKIDFNAILTGSASISSVFRTIEGTGATILLDESEDLKGGKDDRKDLENLLRNGFSKNGRITRSKETAKKDFVPVSFSVFSPKAFGHIHGVDNVLADRNIQTKIVRTINKGIADSEPDEREDPLIYKIRERLYRLWLDYGEEIYKLIPEAKGLIKELSGREMKLWLPIITLALFYEKHGVENLIEKIKAKMLTVSEDKKISDLEENDDFRILIILQNSKIIPIYSRELFSHINSELYKQHNLDKLSDKELGDSLERLGFRRKRTSKGVKWQNITPEKIQEAKERVGLVNPTQSTLSETDSTHETSKNVGNVGSVGSAR